MSSQAYCNDGVVGKCTALIGKPFWKPGFDQNMMKVVLLRDQYYLFIFLDYWQVTLRWSPYGDASLIHSLLIGDTSTTYYTDMAIRVMMTLY